MMRCAIAGLLLGMVVTAIGFTVSTVLSITRPQDAAPENELTVEEIVVQEQHIPTVDNFVDNVNNSVEHEVVVDEVVTQEAAQEEPEYTEEQREILAIIIYQEAGGDAWSDDTRRKVGSVFINRVNSSLFPNTFLEVATQKGQYGTLSWTGLKWPDRATNPGEAHAVERAYTIAEELLIGGSILPDNVIWQAGFQQGDGIYCQQDGFYFCYSEVNK